LGVALAAKSIHLAEIAIIGAIVIFRIIGIDAAFLPELASHLRIGTAPQAVHTALRCDQDLVLPVIASLLIFTEATTVQQQ
jgi:hypothetical protein